MEQALNDSQIDLCMKVISSMGKYKVMDVGFTLKVKSTEGCLKMVKQMDKAVLNNQMGLTIQVSGLTTSKMGRAKNNRLEAQLTKVSTLMVRKEEKEFSS